jgi:hypothetical protein
MFGTCRQGRRVRLLQCIFVLLLGTLFTTAAIGVRTPGASAAGNSPERTTARIQELLNNPVNGTVHLPGGTSIIRPTLRLHSGVRVIGHQTTLKVAQGSGDYQAILAGATPTTDLSDLRITGITFDQNSQGNPATSTWALFHGHPRFVIMISTGSNIMVAGNRFTGGDNVNSIVTGAATKDVTIEHNDFQMINTHGHDHSSIYTSGTSTVIKDNVLAGRAMYDSAAIEVHGDRASVTGNYVNGYYRGANIAASDTVFRNNKVIGALNPVDLWSVQAPGLNNVAVTYNRLNRNLRYWAVLLHEHGRALPAARYTKMVIREEASIFQFHHITVHNNRS